MENDKNLKVSVIMNCLNCSQYLKEAIDSVFAQTYQDWEIIFWDNASTDNSASIAQEYGEKIKYFKSDKIYSLGKARNLALKEAAGKYIAFLDCDDIWLPEKLEKQISTFDKNQKTGLVFSDVIYFNDRGDVFQLYEKNKPPEGYVFRQLFRKNFLCLSSVMIKQEVLLGMAEWFDARFHCTEDLDFFLRITRNWQASYAGGVLVKYRMHLKSWTHSHRSSFPLEHEMLVGKLLTLYPRMEAEYNYELRAMQIRIGYEKFALHWQSAELKAARQALKPFLLWDKMLFLPYVLSYFLPFDFFELLLGIFRKKTYSP